MSTATALQYPIWATGRRKNATARVRLIKGQGKFVVNDHTVNEFLGGQARAIWNVMRPFEVSIVGSQYDIFVDVTGGGVNGQAGAISHGVARAFSKLENTLRVSNAERGSFDPRFAHGRT